MVNHAHESAGTRPLNRNSASGRGSVSMQAVVWLALVALAVAGRLWQPTWNGEQLWHATPLAAVALAAGFLFANPLVAASVPLAALALSNLVLPGYGSLGVAAVVYAATAWPVLLGTCGVLGQDRPRWLAVVGGSLATSLVFFLSTNLAHWAFMADYPRTMAGLGECFVAALPFYRWMPVGDAAWTLATFGLIVAARMAAEAAATRRLRPQGISPRPLD
ncbi:MAG: hypothetical protein DWI04_08120 [Planctomycetota bacterium]|nr:MAG: hypothetical protein DWI04_08120 [Planctomycetota bacterium]